MVATFVLMAVLFGIGRLPYRIVIGGALITTVVSLLIFQYLLKVHFPKGVIGW